MSWGPDLGLVQRALSNIVSLTKGGNWSPFDCSVDSVSQWICFKLSQIGGSRFNLMMILGPEWPVIILMCMWNNPIGLNEECNVYVSDTEVTAWIMGI